MEKNRPLKRFLVLALTALILLIVYLLILRLDSALGVGLWILCVYGLYPMASALAPFWAGLGGVHPLAAFFPIGAPLLFTPCASMGLVCLLIALVASVAGQEWKKRRETEKGSRHGGKKKR